MPCADGLGTSENKKKQCFRFSTIFNPKYVYDCLIFDSRFYSGSRGGTNLLLAVEELFLPKWHPLEQWKQQG